jgi:hypothetical protein
MEKRREKHLSPNTRVMSVTKRQFTQRRYTR